MRLIGVNHALAQHRPTQCIHQFYMPKAYTSEENGSQKTADSAVFAFQFFPQLPTFLDQIQQQVTFRHGGHRAEEYDVLLNRFLDFSCRHWLF